VLGSLLWRKEAFVVLVVAAVVTALWELTTALAKKAIAVPVVPLAVGAVGLYAGSVAAATTGFACGVLLDLALGQPLGVSSLVLVPVGYAAGRYREIRDVSHGLLPIPVGAAAVVGYLVGFTVIAFMLEIQAAVSPVVLEQIVMSTVVTTVLALPVFGLVRRLLRPVLVDDPLARRRPSAARAPGPVGLRGLEI
jgi:rod shape-determining protein MreD